VEEDDECEDNDGNVCKEALNDRTSAFDILLD
jgi:hypothetical protein